MMRSEHEILDLIVNTATHDDRIRAVIMSGSRVNPQARRDIFQDFDIVYLVTDVGSFTADCKWIDRFGELMILQMPEAMGGLPPKNNCSFVYLMQFADGNRIDLTLYPVAKCHEIERESLSRLLLDKDGIVESLPEPSEADYLPKIPSARAFFDSCNEFWWVCPYIAKGLWREEILYAKYMFDHVVRPQLMDMLTWYVGMNTHFSCSPGKCGKYLKQYLEPDLWTMLEKTYSDASYENTWHALFVMCDLFRTISRKIAAHFSFAYPHSDDKKVSAHLRHVRFLPKDAKGIY